MGVKAKLEQELRRALREGRTEDAEVLKQNIVDLQKARGDAAYERALSKKTYTIKTGDSPFSVAEKLYGDDRFAVDLLNANPGVYTFQPGMVIHAPDFNGPAPSLSEEQFAQLQDWGQPDGEDLSLPGYATPDLGPAPEAGAAPEGGTPETAQSPMAETAVTPEPAMTPEYEAQLNQTADAVVALMQKLGLLEGPAAQAGLEAQPATAPIGSGVQARPAAQRDGSEEPMPILTSEIQRVERERRAAERAGNEEGASELQQQFEEYLKLRKGETKPQGEKVLENTDSELELESAEQSNNSKQYDLTGWLFEDMLATLNGPDVVRMQEAFTNSSDNLKMYPYPGMDQAAKLGEGLGGALPIALDTFGSGHKKDVKIRIADEVGRGIVLCGQDNCQWLDTSVPGNIIFGFAMEASGIFTPLYKAGAGYAQIQDTGVNPLWIGSYFDNPEDMAAINFGAHLYNQYGDTLTFEDFKRELTPEVLSSFQSIPSNFVPLFTPHPQENSYPPGYFDQEEN